MPATIEQIRGWFDASDVRYMVDPNDGSLMCGGTGDAGQHFMMRLYVEAEGRWVQLRSVGFLKCPPDHKHLQPVLRLVAFLNYEYRCLKLGWDQKDGEIAAYADLLVADTQPTQGQIFGLIGFFVARLSDVHPRLMVTLTTGQDPGEQKPEGQGEPKPEAKEEEALV
jgi:hypothetical protein